MTILSYPASENHQRKRMLALHNDPDRVIAMTREAFFAWEIEPTGNSF
jgi:hypothetical protein